MHSLPFLPRALRRICLAALLLSSLAAYAQTAFSWETSTPEEQAVDGAGIERMLARIRADRMAVHSFLLVRNGYLVAEYYQAPYTETTPHTMYSVSKSFTSAAIGIAMEQGYISSLDERVLDILQPGPVRNPSPNKEALTLRHLLTMSSGQAADTFSRFASSSDWVKTYLDLPVPEAPGTRFLYDSGATMMLSAVLQKRTGMNLLTFAERNLFKPLGFTTYAWDRGPNDLTAGGWGLHLTPRDMARFGLLYLQEGQWEGQQLVPAEWVHASTSRQISTGEGSGFWNSGYGYQFWMNPFGGYRADGYGGQFIFVLPEKNTVAVFTAGYSSGEPPLQLMRDYVVPSLLVEENADLPGIAAPVGAPTLRLEPASLAIAEGGEAIFRVVAAGQDLTYAWTHNGQSVAGADQSVLRIPNVGPAAAGSYQVRVENQWGGKSSEPVELTLRPAWERPRLVNLSARAVAGASEKTLIVGFGVARGRSSTGLPVLLRGVGPSLGGLGVSGVLPNPDLYLWADAILAGNRSWPAWLAETSQRVGAFPIPGGSRDAATYAVLKPGSYTFHVASAVPGESGVALAECYEAASSPNDFTPELVNLSARSAVAPGDGTLIAGFVIAGTGTKRVLLRGVGPSLTQFGVAGALANPRLTLHGPAGVLGENDDWAGDTRIAAASAAAGAFALPPGSRDAALLVQLPPGPYTVHVTSQDDGPGVALLELYALPD